LWLALASGHDQHPPPPQLKTITSAPEEALHRIENNLAASLFDIFTSAYSATFTLQEATPNPGGNPSGFRFTTNDDNFNFTANVRTQAIPEPSRAVLLALGLFLATSVRRRR